MEAARPCKTKAAAPAFIAKFTISFVNRLFSVSPIRVFKVTGFLVLFTTAESICSSLIKSFKSTQPAPALFTFLTGQPAFISIISAPASSASFAASTSASASPPKICIESGCSLAEILSIFLLFSFPYFKADDDTISAHTSPAPPSRQSKRKGVSVIPAIGASTKLFLQIKLPICRGLSKAILEFLPSTFVIKFRIFTVQTPSNDIPNRSIGIFKFIHI